jgi:SAM-dependent methyltransferase
MTPTTSVAFDRAVDFYDETRGFPPGVETQVADLIVQAGALSSASDLLEIGIGTGRIALPLARRVRHINGVDLSLPMMGRLQAKRTDEPLAVCQGDITRLPFASARYDALIAVHIFHLVAGYQAALREAARVLKPGGVLVHGWNKRDHADELDEAWRAATGAGRGAEVGVKWDERQTMLENNGWQPVGDTHTLPFMTQRAPSEYVDGLRRRLWSHTWRMSDDELANGIRALETYIAEHYPDPHTPQTIQSAFVARAYRPESNAL